MKREENILRASIQKILEQVAHRLNKELVKTSLRLTLEPGTHVPDTLTRIRVLPSISVVGQREKVIRHDKSDAVLIVYVKFLPQEGGEIYKNLKSLGGMIKSLPGVKIVTVLSIDGNPVTHNGERIII